MSLAKRALEMPKTSKERKLIEKFLERPVKEGKNKKQ